MRIALVFALAGATLMYTGCTKDYSGDISDLNKKVSEQASALSALQTQVAAAQSSASEALSSAQNALKEAQAAAKAAEAANNDAEVAALTTKIATIEGNIADLQAKVEALNGLEEKLNKVADQLKKDVDAKVDAALEEIQKELEKAIAQVEGNFSVEALGGTAEYASAKWNPETSKAGKANLAKLTEVFPELAELKKGDKVETFGHIDFIVNPSSVALDDTYKFALIGKDGKDRKVVLGNPAKGFATKAGLNVWNVEVQSPAYNEKGKEYTNADPEVTKLALVVENANGVYAQTDFAYAVETSTNVEAFSIEGNEISFTFDDTKAENSFDAFKAPTATKGRVANPLFDVDGDLYENYFIIEADPADVEEFGIEIEGSKIIFNEAPTRPSPKINFNITAVNVAGRTATLAITDIASVTLNYTKTIAPNAELATKEVTLGYNKTNDNYDVAVDYAIADFGFSALELKEVYKVLNGVPNTVKVRTAKDEEASSITYENVTFFKADGKTAAGAYSEAAIMRVTVKSNDVKTLPGTYTITITDGSVFCAEGELTLANPETCPVKLIDALCKDGVLQIVGATRDANDAITGNIKYSLENALVYDSHEAGIYTKSFVDEDKANDEDSWVDMTANTTFKVAANKANLYKERNFSVKFEWFKNATAAEPVDGTNNYGTFEFKAQAVSPIYAEGGKDAVVVANQTIYIGGEGAEKGTPTSFDVNKIVTSAKYVAGDNVGDSYKVFNTWKTNQTTPGTPATYEYYAVNGADTTAVNLSTSSDKQNLALTSEYYEAFGDDVNSQFVLTEKGLPIEFEDFDLETIKFFNSAVKTSAYTALQAYLKGDGAKPLYLTKAMFDKLAKVWGKYYDKNGNKIGGTTKDKKFIYKHSWAILYDRSWENESYENFDAVLKGANLADHAGGPAYIGIDTPENRDAVQNPLKEDNVAIALFEDYRDLAKKLTAKAGEPGTAPDVNNKDAAKEIKNVKVAFEDPTYAVKFVDKTEFNDPYTTGAEETVSIAPGAKFEAGLNSVTLKAYIEIADNWGMTMKIPFTVTVKTATK